MIRRALEQLPVSTAPDVVDRLEEHLVAFAHDFDPQKVAALARHALAVIDPDGIEPREDVIARQAGVTVRHRDDGSGQLSGTPALVHPTPRGGPGPDTTTQHPLGQHPLGQPARLTPRRCSTPIQDRPAARPRVAAHLNNTAGKPLPPRIAVSRKPSFTCSMFLWLTTQTRPHRRCRMCGSPSVRKLCGLQCRREWSDYYNPGM